MSLLFYTIDPFDSIAFRDGRPFEQDDQGLSEASSVFPPPTPAVCGAVMVALADALGVRSGLEWATLAEAWRNDASSETRARGDDLALLLTPAFSGPYLALGETDPDLYLPCPYDLLFVRGESAPCTRVRPTTQQTFANVAAAGKPWRLDAAQLFRAANEPCATAEGWFLTAPIFEACLNDTARLPTKDSLIKLSATVSQDSRVGLTIDKELGTAVKSKLYAAEHQRLGVRCRPVRRGTKDNQATTVRIAVEGPELSSLCGAEIDQIVPFGGEGRCARIRGPYRRNARPVATSLPRGVTGSGHLPIRIVALTPIPCVEGAEWGLNLGLIEVLRGSTIDGAVHTRPTSVGFIDRKRFKTGAVRVLRCFAAGSTWFASVPCPPCQEQAHFERLIASAITQALAPADLAIYGFGRFRIGAV